LGDSTPDPNEDYTDKDVKEGDKIPANNPPTKDGDEFEGWKDQDDNIYQPGDEIPVDKDITLTPVWKHVTVDYLVEYYKENSNGTYSVVHSVTKKADIGTTVTAEEMDYPHYHLNTDMSKLTGEVIEPVMQNGELEGLTLKVYYDLNTVTVRYELGEDATPDPNEDYTDKTVKYQDTVTLNDPPTKDGYIFVDWFDGTNHYLPDELIIVEDDVTLVPTWEKIIIPMYYVEHYKELTDGSYAIEASEEFESKVGENVTAVVRTYDNYHLNEDLSNLSGVVTEPVEENGVVTSLVLKVYYDRNEAKVKYDITDSEPGDDVTYDDETVKCGDNVTLKDPPRKDGYIFIGWTDGTNDYHHGDLITITEDIVLVPKWEKEPTPISDDKTTYTIEYYKQQDDGTYVIEKTDVKEAEIGEIITVEPEDYERYHVNTDTSTLTGEVPEPTDENGQTKTLVLKVYYDINTVTVKYDLNGGTGASGVDYGDETLTEGASTTVKTAPTRSGYIFTGWSDGTVTYQPGDDLTALKDVVLTAQWQSRSGGGGGSSSTVYRKLTYESNGGTEYEPDRIVSGKEVKIDKTPTRDGYKFTGWYSDAELTNPISSIRMTTDVIIYAGWEEITDATPAPTASPDELYVPEKLNGDDHFAYVFGYPDESVRPYANITRAEVATIFFRLLKENVRQSNWTEESEFDDVNGDWYTTAVSTMEKLGILEGRDNNLFEPDAPITRAEFAAVCARFDDQATVGELTFTDIADHWAEQEIRAAANRGWVKGYEDNSFRPNQNITRSEAMALINRVLERLPENENDLLSNEMVTWPDNADTSAWYYLDVQEATNEHDFERKTDSIHETWTQIKDRSLLGL
jgi:uncharacterized repeat protein (TIGR02543 family)